MNQGMISRLQINSEIGRGHFGRVCEGLDPIRGRVAVKTLQRAVTETMEEWVVRKANFLNEGQRLRDAEHDNVVRVYQILEAPDDDALWLVMEYCENGSLQWEYENGPMLLSRLRAILSDAALGLQAVHARNMVHRDIKPGNILVGANNRAKISDFGLVTNELLFGYASLAGYIEHLAKETFELGVTSIRTDVWAFGMTTYRLLHGHAFYSELPRENFEQYIREGGFARRLPWLPHIPDEWRRFVRQAMHDEPERRFQNATDILRGLEKLPVSPEWTCNISGEQVVWSYTRKARRVQVVWNRTSQRKHDWEARSFPLGDGRTKRLGGSNGAVGLKKTLDGLHKFFENFR